MKLKKTKESCNNNYRNVYSMSTSYNISINNNLNNNNFNLNNYYIYVHRSIRNLGILFMLALFILIIDVPNASALCCGSACYPGGVCDSNDVWYEGCKDEQGNAHPPYPDDNSLIGECSVCKCASPDECSWQLNSRLCQGTGQSG